MRLECGLQRLRGILLGRYDQLYQAELNEDSSNTLVDSFLERRAPMLLRIAKVLTLADRQWMIEERHIEASLAWIR